MIGNFLDLFLNRKLCVLGVRIVIWGKRFIIFVLIFLNFYVLWDVILWSVLIFNILSCVCDLGVLVLVFD